MNNNILPPSKAQIRKAFLGTKQEQALHKRRFYEALRRFMRFVQRSAEPSLVEVGRRNEIAITRLLRRMKKVKA